MTTQPPTDSAFGIEGLALAGYGTDLTDEQWERLQRIEAAPAAPESFRPDAVHVTPDGHIDDVGCWCGPAVHPVAGLMHTLTADESDR